MDMNYGQLGGGLGQFLGSLFNDPRDPWAEGQRAYSPWMEKAGNNFNPFIKGGQQGMGKFQNWLSGQENPSEFINNLMGQYQESPYAHYLQDQTQKAGLNAASANGLVGSTPYLQQSQANAAGIVSGDMQNWLARVLGINTQYGQGQQHLMDTGFNAATNQSNIFGNRGRDEAEMAYGKEQAGQRRFGDFAGGFGNIIGGLFGL